MSRKITHIDKLIQLVFAVEREREREGYFDEKEFAKLLWPDLPADAECKVQLCRRSWEDKQEQLSVTATRQYAPVVLEVVTAWDSYWAWYDEKKRKRKEDAKRTADLFRNNPLMHQDLLDQPPAAKSLRALVKSVKDYYLSSAESSYKGEDYGMAACYYGDAIDLLWVVRHAADGNREKARRKANGLDTIVRESIPGKLWEWLNYDNSEPQL